MNIAVNYVAVLVGAIVSMVLGFLWYGPVFGKKWMALSGINPGTMTEEQKKGMNKSYALMFVGSLVTSYVLWHMIVYSTGFMQKSGAMMGMQAGFWIWLGFVAPVIMGSVLWEGKSWSLFALNDGYQLVNLSLIGAILAAWM